MPPPAHIMLPHKSAAMKLRAMAYCDPLLMKACEVGAVAEVRLTAHKMMRARTHWHHQVTFESLYQVARLLEKTNPACRDRFGDYPLTAAIRHAQWGTAILLLECDARVQASINVRTNDKFTPLLLCVLRNSIDHDIPCTPSSR